MSSYFEAVAADGPKVVEWFRVTGHYPVEGGLEALNAAVNRRLREWERGDQARIDALDKVCQWFGVHPLELPEDVWMEHYGVQKFEVKHCEVCAEPIMRNRHGGVRQSGRTKYQSLTEYRLRRYCSAKCANKARSAGK